MSGAFLQSHIRGQRRSAGRHHGTSCHTCLAPHRPLPVLRPGALEFFKVYEMKALEVQRMELEIKGRKGELDLLLARWRSQYIEQTIPPACCLRPVNTVFSFPATTS
jgi:hypothetical protein